VANATEMRPCFVIFQIALAIGFSLFVFHFSLKKAWSQRRQPFLPFYLFTFLPLKSLFTFKSPFIFLPLK